ncbi:hypothetical protein SVAN01_05055 [Stagonosporopsis vannaccii]|nr:hypothetical protein SVAN01_05055 [Stagonosporopsis vannaccii]
MRGTAPDARWIPICLSHHGSKPRYQVDAPKDKTTSWASSGHDLPDNLSSKSKPPPIALSESQHSFNVIKDQKFCTSAVESHVAANDKSLYAVTQKARAPDLLVNDYHHEAEEHAKATGDRITMLELEVTKQKQDLEVAKKETVKINEAMTWI